MSDTIEKQPTEKVIDPIHGHIVGPYKCEVEKCLGHRHNWQPSIHRLHTQYFETTRRLKSEKKAERAERKLQKVRARREKK